MVHYFAFAFPCLLERKAVTFYDLLCTVFLGFVVGEGRCHTLRFVLFSFALVCFASAGRTCHRLQFVLHCFATFRFVLLCFALLCIVL